MLPGLGVLGHRCSHHAAWCSHQQGASLLLVKSRMASVSSLQGGVRADDVEPAITRLCTGDLADGELMKAYNPKITESG